MAAAAGTVIVLCIVCSASFSCQLAAPLCTVVVVGGVVVKPVASALCIHSCPVPHLPVASLWPPLAQANTQLLAAAAAEPQWLRASAVCGGGGGLAAAWFEVPAWRQVAAGLQQLLTR